MMKKTFILTIIITICIYSLNSNSVAGDLIWPVDCVPGTTCVVTYPDVDGDGRAFDCGIPGYTGHEGTDIIVNWSQMDNGVDVYAAAEGKVLWVFNGKYDRCPNPNEPDCQDPPMGWGEPGLSNGYRVCTPLGDYCKNGIGNCFWCFDGGNVIVIKHEGYGTSGVFATRYDHLKNGSILVSPGDDVKQGQKIAELGSAGHSDGPHLHFEVWGSTFYDPVDPWAGPCGPNVNDTLWKTWTVIPSAGSGGTISPNTEQTVNYGSTKSFMVTPNAGYTALAGGTCGGGPAIGTTQFTYKTNPITANCTVSATFTRNQVSMPTFNPDGGSHVGISVSVVVSCETTGATIRYAINGTEPTESSPTVTNGGTVIVPIPGTLKARAWKSGMDASDVKTATYIRKTEKSLGLPWLMLLLGN